MITEAVREPFNSYDLRQPIKCLRIGVGDHILLLSDEVPEMHYFCPCNETDWTIAPPEESLTEKLGLYR